MFLTLLLKAGKHADMSKDCSNVNLS